METFSHELDGLSFEHKHSISVHTHTLTDTPFDVIASFLHL